MNKKIHTTYQEGSSVVTLMVFMVIIASIVTTSVSVAINNSRATNVATNSLEAEQYAQSGIENSLLRLLRDPSYTGETLTFDEGTAEVSVSGTTITSTGSSESAQRTIQVEFTYNDNILTVVEWSDMF